MEEEGMRCGKAEPVSIPRACEGPNRLGEVIQDAPGAASGPCWAQCHVIPPPHTQCGVWEHGPRLRATQAVGWWVGTRDRHVGLADTQHQGTLTGTGGQWRPHTQAT